ncbi:hypothetical protein M407DRAFT_19732 [Tulasnella calospora MUT 4182]|uniref:HpcH/HpaI aldolase/citrate lyase domain-containing protein n=1 Tax=Tulasnella calospora MUT 4182 TaxID=1051891 RepID=A0A0C3QHM2_9AGAM|nr:hypothetical protein M407DRAFT_19732 [Tulasnella calospora MUT 4182]
MLEKSTSMRSDTIIYDFEDAVAPSQKVSARTVLSKFLEALPGGSTPEIAVRVNPTVSPLFVEDISSVVAMPQVQTIVLPKVHERLDLELLDQVLRGAGRTFSIIASIESAQAIWNIGEIAGWRSSTGSAFVSGLLFAAEDYCADTSIIRTRSRTELLYARSHLVNAAKSFGLHAIDMVCVNYKDPDYLREECEDGRRLGFDGKQAIHPNQVQVIQETFVPSEREILRATRIIAKMDEAYAQNKGAFGLDDTNGASSASETEMIDEPMVKQARKTLERARHAGLVIPDVSTT